MRASASIVRAQRGSPRQIEIQLEMARFGRVQALEQLGRAAAERRAQGREALARTRFDERAADHQVDFALRLGSSRPGGAVSPHSGPGASRRGSMRSFLMSFATCS